MQKTLSLLAIVFALVLGGPRLAVPSGDVGVHAAPLDCFTEAATASGPGPVFACGLDAYARRDYDSAIAYFTRAIELDPSDAGYYNWLGLSHGANREFDRAVQDFSMGIDLAPAEPAWWANRAWAYAGRGYATEAIADLTQAIQLSPGSAALYASRADVYSSISDHDRAIADYSRSIELGPGSASYYLRRGVSYDYKHDYDRAIADKAQAVALDPERGEFYYSLSLSYRAKGDAAQADRNLALAVAKGYRPPTATVGSPRQLAREYQERDSQGRVRTVQQWSDGAYTAGPWEAPAAPSPTPSPQSLPSAPNYLRVTIVGYDFAKSVYKVRVGWKATSDNHTGFVLTTDNLPTPLDMGANQTSIDFWAAGSQGAWICVSVAAKNAAGLSPWTNGCTALQ